MPVTCYANQSDTTVKVKSATKYNIDGIAARFEPLTAVDRTLAEP